MKKILLLMLIAAVLLSVDHPEIKDRREALYAQIKSEFVSATRATTDKVALEVRDTLLSSVSLNSEKELDYVKQFTENKAQLSKFYDEYCLKNKNNLYFRGSRLVKICHEINQAFPSLSDYSL